MPYRDPQEAESLRPASGAAVVFVLAIALGAFVVVWSVYDTRRRAQELSALMGSSGAALAEALGHAVEDSLRASLEIEELASNRLLDQARLLDRLDRIDPLGGRQLDELAEAMGLDAVILFDRTLRLTRGAGDTDRMLDATYQTGLRRLAEGDADFVVFGPRESGDPATTEFAVSLRRADGGQLLVAMDLVEMLAFQEEIGADHLLTAVARTGGILDAWLENDRGEIVAGAARDLSDGLERLEFNRTVPLASGEPGRLRVGLSAEVLHTAEQAGQRRTLVLAVAMFGLALALTLATAARQRSRALRGQAARIRATTDAVLSGMADAVVLLDRRSVIRLVNPVAERLFGKPAEELVGRPCAETWCANLMKAVTRRGAAQEVRLEPEGVEPFPALVSVSEVEVPTMGVIGTAVVLRDIRVLRALEEQTRRAESLTALGTLAAAVAHEVRNPLNSISVGVQRLESEFSPSAESDDYRRLTGLLRGEVERLDAIVNRFLDFARAPRLQPRPADLVALIDDILPLLRQSAPRNVSVTFDRGATAPALFDAVAMRQVVLNLVRNAVEAIGTSSGKVTIRTAGDGDRVRLEVVDDGPGIPAAEREKVFGYGYTTKPSGTGMGLAIVQRLVVEMGGSVDLEPAPGGGSRAVVRLHAAGPDEAQREDAK